MIVIVLKGIKNIIVAIISYISFFQFLFNFVTIDQLITVSLLPGVDRKYNNLILSGFLLFLWLLCSLLLKYIEASKEEKVGKTFHQLQHQIRNIIFDLRKENEEIGTDSTFDSYYSNIKYKTESICNEMVEFFTICFNRKFNICIKMLDTNTSRNVSSLGKMKVITLCRSGINKVERSKNDATENIKVVDNTDFESILKKDNEKGSNNVFATNNLIFYCLTRLLLRRPYKTSSKKYFRKYNSVMVVPIRINSKRMPKVIVQTGVLNSYQVFGFLCIDYRWRMSKNLMRSVLEYEKAMGDLLYIYFYEVINGDNIIYNRNLTSEKK